MSYEPSIEMRELLGELRNLAEQMRFHGFDGCADELDQTIKPYVIADVY